jgi:hypothetical protein
VLDESRYHRTALVTGRQLSSGTTDVFKDPRCLQGSPMSSGFPDVFRVPHVVGRDVA